MAGEGDICASYSADRIGGEQPVRRPFSFEGQLWVCIGSDGRDRRAFQLVDPATFHDPTFTYGGRVRDGHEGRRDPNGYGMLVTHRRATMVLRGPETRFVRGTERLGALFHL
ncbi:MAG: hypothetical protein ABJ205_00855 [Erythrobacter sp.]|uniref:hypothetical protein n=1 Tax=Erythrobacter sp. TaxID=1042 RepID=UPI003267121D